MTLVERALDLFSPANARPTVAGILPGRGTKTSLTLGFTSLRSHPVPTLRWGCENTIKYFLLHFPHPGAISPMGAISPVVAISRMITVVSIIAQVINAIISTTFTPIIITTPSPPTLSFIFAFGIIVICQYYSYCCTGSFLGLLIGLRRVLRIQYVYICLISRQILEKFSSLHIR